MFIQDWFLNKNFTQNERYALETGNVTTERETEKAVLIKVESDHGNFTKWIPKSVIGIKEEAIPTEKKEIGLYYNEKNEEIKIVEIKGSVGISENGKKYMMNSLKKEKTRNFRNELIELAKNNGLKVRSNTKTIKIIKELYKNKKTKKEIEKDEELLKYVQKINLYN